MSGLCVPAARPAGPPLGAARLLVAALAALLCVVTVLAGHAAEPSGVAAGSAVSVAADCTGHDERCVSGAQPTAVGASRTGVPAVPPGLPLGMPGPVAPPPAATDRPHTSWWGAHLLVAIGVSRR